LLKEKESDELSFTGDMKYTIEFKMYHSIHNRYVEDGISIVKLFWSSTEFNKEIIP